MCNQKINKSKFYRLLTRFLNKNRYMGLKKFLYINDHNDGYNINIDDTYNLYCFRFDWLAVKFVIQENKDEVSYYIENINIGDRSDVFHFNKKDVEDVIHDLNWFNEENKRFKKLMCNWDGF